MKRKYIITLLFIGLLTFISCDEVKKVYHDTFRDSKETQEELSELYDRGGRSDNSKEREDSLVQKALNEAYDQLLDVQIAELDKSQIDNIKEMIGRDIEQRSLTEVSLLFQPHKLDEIQAELYHFLNTEEVMLYASSLFVEHNRVRLSAVNPKNKNEVDWYWYETKTGEWIKKDPVKLSKRNMDRMEKNVMPFSSIKLSTAHTVYHEAAKRLSEIEGAELPSSLIYNHYSHNKHWRVTLNGSRANYTLEADKDGKITKFEMK